MPTMRLYFHKSALALAFMIAGGHVQAADTPLLRERTEANRPLLLLLGTPHFGNPHQDVSKTIVPDVMSPQRQAEVARVVQALAAFKPTKVMVEVARSKQDQLSASYRGFLAGSYQLGSSESEQIGMRVAAAAGLADIHAVDWNKMPPGTEQDFDWQQWASSHDKTPLLARIRDNRSAADASRKMPETKVVDWLIEYNEPDALARSHRDYFDFTMLGDEQQQPGANWVANWYGRNLKIFARLVELAALPSDRVLVIYGAGHIPTLREFALQSGAFTVADPMPLLRQARQQ